MKWPLIVCPYCEQWNVSWQEKFKIARYREHAETCKGNVPLDHTPSAVYHRKRYKKLGKLAYQKAMRRKRNKDGTYSKRQPKVIRR